MNLKKLTAGTLAVFAAAALLAGCGGEKEDGKGAGRKEKDRCRHYAGLLGRNHGVCQGRSQKTGP